MHDCNADVQADAPTLAQRAKQLKSEGLTNVQIGRELGVHRNKVTELLK
jgi:orotate phosphoribosyltransferase-like protein